MHQKEVTELKNKLSFTKEELSQMSLEKEFYFAKLRKIEEICQDNEDNAIVQQILDVLYEQDEEHGFVIPNDD